MLSKIAVYFPGVTVVHDLDSEYNAFPLSLDEVNNNEQVSTKVVADKLDSGFKCALRPLCYKYNTTTMYLFWLL